MANIVTVSAQLQNRTPPSKQHNIGVSSILDVLDYTDANFPFIKSVVYTTNPVLTALYCNEAASTIKAAANAPLA
jgi:hypothetical protein